MSPQPGGSGSRMFASVALTLTATLHVVFVTPEAQAQSARAVHPTPSDPSMMRGSAPSASASSASRFYPGLVNPPRLDQTGMGIAQIGAPIPTPVPYAEAPMPPTTPGGPMPIGRMENVNRINPTLPVAPTQRGIAAPVPMSPSMGSLPSANPAMLPPSAPAGSRPMAATTPQPYVPMMIPEAPVYISRDSGGPRILRALLGLPSWPSRQARQRQAELEARRMEVIRRNALRDPSFAPASMVYGDRF